MTNSHPLHVEGKAITYSYLRKAFSENVPSCLSIAIQSISYKTVFTSLLIATLSLGAAIVFPRHAGIVVT